MYLLKTIPSNLFNLLCSFNSPLKCRFIIFRSLKITRKQKIVIEEQKLLVEHQKNIVEEHQKDIVRAELEPIINQCKLENATLIDAAQKLKNTLIQFGLQNVIKFDYIHYLKKINRSEGQS